MRLSDLCKLVGAEPAAADVGDVEVLGVSSDSRRTRAGDVFVALRGGSFDGAEFAAEAVGAGAVAIVSERTLEGVGAPVLVVGSARDAVTAACEGVYGEKLRVMRIVGVTGTNGKTTVANIYRALVQESIGPCGIIGTIGHVVGDTALETNMTTPDCAELHRLLAAMHDAGCRHAVMEVSSHALAQGRTGQLEFACGIFTNLTQDHLDYHGTMEEYLDAKAKLFESLQPEAIAVLNADDAASEEFARRTRARVVTYAVGDHGQQADYMAEIREISIERTAFRLTGPGVDLQVEMPLLGRHNVENALAAAAAAFATGVEPGGAARAFLLTHAVPGRLERVEAGQPFRVLVDYAHTEDALRSVLSAVLALRPKRILTVFGCGGDRDRTKRPKMGCAAEELSDEIFVTSDNPRSEKPEAIIDEIVAGLCRAQRATIEPDRRKAIEMAVGAAEAGDVVLIAGKGHETYQIVGDRRLDFDDRLVAAEALKRRMSAGSVRGAGAG